MLGKYEKRHFENQEKLWIGRYQHLTNALHWHFECELIRIVSGAAKIQISNQFFDAVEGDCFFCSPEELHCILGTEESCIEAIIFDKSLARDITDFYALASPRLENVDAIEKAFADIHRTLAEKCFFYAQALENYGTGIIIDIFNRHPSYPKTARQRAYENIVKKINDEFDYITFEDAARYSGYSPSHFSKMFKRLLGINFSEYLNIIRVENAIALIQREPQLSMTAVSLKCGFSTVRNFNRVFKQLTGFSPRSLPKDFSVDTMLHCYKASIFDPTHTGSKIV